MFLSETVPISDMNGKITGSSLKLCKLNRCTLASINCFWYYPWDMELRYNNYTYYLKLIQILKPIVKVKKSQKYIDSAYACKK